MFEVCSAPLNIAKNKTPTITVKIPGIKNGWDDNSFINPVFDTGIIFV